MKKIDENVAADGKGKRRALKDNLVAKALQDCLEAEGGRLRNFALGLCRDQEEVEELIQEACYRVLTKSSSYNPAQPIKSWLFKILHNVFIDSRRGKGRRGLHLDHREGEELFLHEMLAEDSEPILEQLERQEVALQVRSALRKLRAVERSVLALCDADGCSYRDAAKALGIPLGTVRSRLWRARAKLRDEAIRLGLS